MTGPKYPGVVVKFVKNAENTFVTLGRITKAMRALGVTKEDIDTFTNEVFNADSYDDAIEIMRKWVDLDDGEDRLSEEELHGFDVTERDDYVEEDDDEDEDDEDEDDEDDDMWDDEDEDDD